MDRLPCSGCHSKRENVQAGGTLYQGCHGKIMQGLGQTRDRRSGAPGGHLADDAAEGGERLVDVVRLCEGAAGGAGNLAALAAGEVHDVQPPGGDAREPRLERRRALDGESEHAVGPRRDAVCRRLGKLAVRGAGRHHLERVFRCTQHTA